MGDRNQNSAWRDRWISRLTERTQDELIGICRGILADGLVVQAEAEFLLNWLEANGTKAQEWPMDMLLGRLHGMLSDNHLDNEEEAELLDLLMKLTGDGLLPDESRTDGSSVSSSTQLPIDDPPPPLEFQGKTFCFTGKMCSGSRRECEQVVGELGGTIESGVSQDLDYLVIGSIGTVAWIHSTHGRKIEKAVDLRSRGHKIRIISEEHWIGQIRTIVNGAK